jgi:hypothetical protein
MEHYVIVNAAVTLASAVDTMDSEVLRDAAQLALRLMERGELNEATANMLLRSLRAEALLRIAMAEEDGEDDPVCAEIVTLTEGGE